MSSENLREPLLTRQQLAKRLNVSVRTVDSWVRRKVIPVIAIGRLRRFSWPDICAALQQFERKAITQDFKISRPVSATMP